MAAVNYFSGTEQVTRGIGPMDNRAFYARFGFVHRFKSYDGFSKWTGQTDAGALVPITRIVYRKSNPSNHKCDARCRNARGHDCECSCDGQFHGADA